MEKTSQPKYAAVAHHRKPSVDNVAPFDDYLRSLKQWGKPGPTGQVLYLKEEEGVAHVSTKTGMPPRATATAEARAMTDFLYQLGFRFTTDEAPALQKAGRALYDLANNPGKHGRVADTEALRACIRALRDAIDEAYPDKATDEPVSLDASSHGKSTEHTHLPAVPSAEELIGASLLDTPSKRATSPNLLKQRIPLHLVADLPSPGQAGNASSYTDRSSNKSRNRTWKYERLNDN